MHWLELAYRYIYISVWPCIYVFIRHQVIRYFGIFVDKRGSRDKVLLYVYTFDNSKSKILNRGSPIADTIYNLSKYNHEWIGIAVV